VTKRRNRRGENGAEATSRPPIFERGKKNGTGPSYDLRGELNKTGETGEREDQFFS